VKRLVSRQREQMLREPAVGELTKALAIKLKALRMDPVLRSDRGTTLRLTQLRLAWNFYYLDIVRAFMRIRIALAKEDSSLLTDEALDELQNEIIDGINHADSLRKLGADRQFTTTVLGGFHGEHFLDVVRLSKRARHEIRGVKAQRDLERDKAVFRTPPLLTVLMLGVIAASAVLSWLGPLGFGVSLFRHSKSVLVSIFVVVLGVFVMRQFIHPAIRDGLIMAIMRPTWRVQNRRSATLRGPIPSIFTLVVSNTSEAYFFVYFGLLLMARVFVWTGPGPPAPYSWFASCLSVVLMATFGYGQTRRSRKSRKILLLRRFDRDVSKAVKRGLVPALTAYGEVTTVRDASFDRVIVPHADQMPTLLPPSDLTFSNESWMEGVKAQIAESDLIVVDVSEISAAVAWEFLQTVSHSHGVPIILVSSAWHLGKHRSSLFRSFVGELAKQADDAEATLRSLEAPLTYSPSFINVVFSVRLYRRMRHLAELAHK